MNEQNQNSAVPQPTEPTPPVVQPTAPTPPVAPPTPPVPNPTPPAQAVPNPVVAQPIPTEDDTEREPSVLENVGASFKALMGAVFSWIILPIAIVLILHNFVFQAYHVLGTSMVNTLHETDYLIISKLGYTEALVGRIFGQNTKYIPGRGQIIVFHYPKDPSKVFVKRVIGIPGDRVVVQNGTVTVYNQANPNGFNPDKKYELADTTTLIDTDEVVQPGNVFVMGDNRSPGGSYDSREWGQLPSSYIIGNAVLRLIPLDQVRIF